jgi:LytS/YehU family sensor histidine kinase
LLPPMLLQPYIENAVKHGMRRMPLKQGLIQVLFDRNGERLRCRVIDNGPGRANTAQQKAHSGQGMLISARRAQLYDIQTNISDNYPSGTIVTLSVLLKINDKNPETNDHRIYS